VTGRFSQERRGIWELKVEGDAEPIGVTPHHPLWSLDRHAWVSASELRPYERLATISGPARLMYAVDTKIADPVYNIEVEGENCYRVGEKGTLVHNVSSDACTAINITETGPSGAHYAVTPRQVGGKLYNQPYEVVARLAIQNGGSSSPGAINLVRRHIGFANDEVGHLVGMQFGGRASLESPPSSGNGNFVPQGPLANDEYNQIEEAIARILRSDSCAQICLHIKIHYDEARANLESPYRPYRPFEFRIKWWQAGQQMGNDVLDNF
jgi:hypothetical protein